MTHPGFGYAERVSASQSKADAKGLRVYPFVRWATLFPQIVWLQGQHCLAIGGTGSGKSTLMGVMLRRRDYVVVYVSKGQDDTLDGPLFRSYERYTRWPPRKKHHKVILWPKNGRDVKETRAIKHDVFSNAMNDILLHRGGWCEAFDEVHYMSDSLKLETELEDTEEQGRSAGISAWGNSQRPAKIPLAFYANASHAFFFLTQEGYDKQRLGSIRNKHTNSDELMYNIERLDPHEFVYIDRTGKIPPVRSIVER